MTFTDTSTDPAGDIRARILRPDGTGIGLDFAVANGATHDFDSHVAGLKDGGFVVTWTRFFSGGDGDYDLRYRIFNADGTARGTEQSTDSVTERDTLNQSVAGLTGGGFVVAFQDGTSTSSSTVKFQRYDAAGVALGPQTQFGNAGTSSPDIVAMKDGGFAIAYADQTWNNHDKDITLRIFNADGSARTSPILVNAGTTAGLQYQPSVTVLANGFIVVGWLDETADNTLFQAFDSNGVAIGSYSTVVGGFGTLAGLAGGTLAVSSSSSNAKDEGDDASIVSSLVDLIRRTTGDDTSETLNGWNWNDEIVGLGGNDTMSGGTGDDLLYGGSGADKLTGGPGVDIMSGGIGDDWFFVDDANDKVYENANEGTADRVFAGMNYTLNEGAQVEIISTTDNAGVAPLKLTGNEFSNTIFGNAGANTLSGGGGTAADVLVGFGGDDSYIINHTYDSIRESAGGGNDRAFVHPSASIVSWTLNAGAQVEIISTDFNPGTAAINLTGNEFANAIYGNAGTNVLNGGLGNDTLTGMGGTDFFLFDTAISASNVDRISDFDVATDTIRLKNTIFTGLPTGALAAGAFNTGTTATQADDRILYDSASGRLFFDKDGLGGTAAQHFATVTNPVGVLSAADFFVV